MKEKSYFKELGTYFESFESEKNLNRYWSNASQNTNKVGYSIEKGHFKMTTTKGTNERVKIRFNKRNLTVGSYEWKVYAPKMRLNEYCSIGAFLYRDDKHELDFEIGSGNLVDRKKVAAKRNELLLFCSSQGNPSGTKIVKIGEESWYTLKIELSYGANNKYLAKWFLDGKEIHQLQLNFGKRFKFKAFCSLENIRFVGDKPTSGDNYVLFDYFKYVGGE